MFTRSIQKVVAFRANFQFLEHFFFEALYGLFPDVLEENSLEVFLSKLKELSDIICQLMSNMKLAFDFFVSWVTALNIYPDASIEVSLQKGFLTISEFRVEKI